jgi:hypothetical protein
MEAGDQSGTVLRVEKDPLPAEGQYGEDLSHLLITGVGLEDELLHAALGRAMEVYRVRSL